MITIKNNLQIQKMRDSGKILYDALRETAAHVKSGISTKELDNIAEKYINQYALPAFKGYEGFPATLCTSVNDTVVHGIPSYKEILKEGDIISLDCGVILDGWNSDSALTVGVGKISKEAQQLIDYTEQAFFAGAKAAIANARLGDIGYAVSSVANQKKYGVVRDLTGHGIGKTVHEDPSVYNFGKPGKGSRIYKNMTICIEPMITAGTWEVYMLDDGWTIKTLDGSLCSHYEHTLLINDGLPELLTYPGFEWKE